MFQLSISYKQHCAMACSCLLIVMTHLLAVVFVLDLVGLVVPLRLNCSHIRRPRVVRLRHMIRTFDNPYPAGTIAEIAVAVDSILEVVECQTFVDTGHTYPEKGFNKKVIQKSAMKLLENIRNSGLKSD